MSAETLLRKSSIYGYYLEVYWSSILKNQKAFLKFNFNYSHRNNILTSGWLLIVEWSMVKYGDQHFHIHTQPPATSIKPHVENASKEDKLEFYPSLLNYSTIYTVVYLSE